AAAAFVAIYFFKVPFPIIIVAAGLIGFFGGKISKEAFFVIGHSHKRFADTVIGDDEEPPHHTKPSLIRALKICAVCLTLWWIPVVLIGLLLGWNHTLFRQGIFFSKASMVTFGGAYAVLPYVSQQAVEHYKWLTAPQMLDGLGLAETTPGPLIMV